MVYDGIFVNGHLQKVKGEFDFRLVTGTKNRN